MNNPQYKKTASEIFSRNLNVLEKQYLVSVDEYKEMIEDSVAMDQARWIDETASEAHGYYDNTDNKYRHVKLFLYERTKHLSDMLDCPERIINPAITTDETHSLTFFVGDEEIMTMNVKDGTQLEEKDLPPYDHSVYSGWYYKTAQVSYSRYIPIYEDMALVLRENKPAS